MRRIKYIKSDKFFAKEYKDGIIVAFKNVGDNNSSYADQIHQMVSKNFGVDLFVSDIIESISVTNSHKDSIKDSLFIYAKNGVSISACRISSCPNKDYIEVKYDSEKVLTVQQKRSKRLWCVCILVLLCICGYNTIFDDDINTDEPEVEIQKVGADEPSAPIGTITPNNNEKNESEKDNKPIEKIVEVVETNVAQDEEVRQDVATTPTVPEDFILIPNGTLKRYLTGYDDKWNNIYEDFTLDGFYICKHEVTQKEYIRVMNENPSFIKGDDLPVNAVQYIDAIKYCNARSKAEGYDGFYNIDNNIVTIKPHSNGYRLPNRYEWVYAARKDESTKTEYASGNNISKVAWYGGNSKNTLHAVCTTKEPNGRGIYDMNGNVSEWLWEKDFQRCNCHIGGDFLTYVGFYEKDVVGSTVCSEENGFRVVLITKELINKNVESPTSVKCHKLEYYHAVEAKVQREREDAERDRQRKAMKAEANEYVRIADQAYNDYADSFNESKGIVALTNYKKALDLNKKHGLFFVSERERIEQKVNILEKELK